MIRTPFYIDLKLKVAFVKNNLEAIYLGSKPVRIFFFYAFSKYYITN